MSEKLFAQVILPLPLGETFTYSVPESLRTNVIVGMRVLVPFGNKHLYTGLISDISPVAPPPGIPLKEIMMCLDNGAIVRTPQIRFWQWIADYYLCSIGEVFKAALPSGLKIESETRVDINTEASQEAFEDLSERELSVLSYLKEEGSTAVRSIAGKLSMPTAEATISKMVAKGLLIVAEKLVERYRAIKKPYVRPLFARGDKKALDDAFENIRRSPKQESVLVALLALSEFNRTDCPLIEVPLDVLLDKTGATRTIVNALCQKGLCEIYGKEVNRFTNTFNSISPLPSLSPAQEKVLGEIHTSFHEKDVTLLRGVTSSGKTEIYCHLADYVLRKGEQVLFLVPEIALTTQLTQRLQKVFGDKVVIYHSKFSDNERVEIWNKLLNSHEPMIILGARSSVFLPFAKLGLVIVDEEHESSYKQYDPAPRYNGRDAAIVLANLHGAKTLLGSATPTIETYHKAKSGKFGLVEITERFGNAPLPKIDIVDMRRERKMKAVSGYFSLSLIRAASDVISRGRQSIFFHNRRGYAPLARCKMCAFTPKCNYCDVSLTYHRRMNKLQCHYCGALYPVPEKCPECHEPAIEIIGYGTERLEDEISEEFAGKKVLRMDLDTTRNKEGYSKIIDEFSKGNADILVGTQMVTKGLDFGGVELVGILNADSLINFPDFRAAERAFNMMEQVAGRAGRRNDSGRVIIQTYNPEHPVLDYVRRHDYTGFFAHELEERRAFSFPPFSRIINIYLRHRDPRTVAEIAAKFASSLKAVFGQRISGPQEPPVSRVQSLYIRKIMLKVESEASMSKVKDILRSKYAELTASPLVRGVNIHYDVDPA